MDLSVFKRKSYFLVRILFVSMGMGSFALSANAALTRLEVLKAQQTETQAEVKGLQHRIKENQRWIKDLDSGRYAKLPDDLKGSCKCMACLPFLMNDPQEVSPTPNLERQDSQRDPGRAVCFQAYSHFKSRLEVLQAQGLSCYQALTKCTELNPEVKTSLLKRENQDLSNEIHHLKDSARQVSAKIAQERRACPECERRKSPQEGRKRGLGDYLVQGLVVLAPLIVQAIVGGGAGGMMLGSYFDTGLPFALSQCSQIGMPCLGLALLDGLFGLGTGGMFPLGLLSLLNLGMGFPSVSIESGLPTLGLNGFDPYLGSFSNILY